MKRSFVLLFALLTACGPKLADLEERCEGGDGSVCYALAILYQYGDRRGAVATLDLDDLPPRDEARALQYSKRGCEHNDAASCQSAAWSHHFGHGTEIDLAEAQRLYQRACDLANLESCGHAAQLIHERGDAEAARALFERTCERSDSFSCYALAELYPGTTARKAELYERACELSSEDGSGCWSAGALLSTDSSRRSRAVELLEIACQRMGSNSRPCRDAEQVRQGNALATERRCATLPNGANLCWDVRSGNP